MWVSVPLPWFINSIITYSSRSNSNSSSSSSIRSSSSSSSTVGAVVAAAATVVVVIVVVAVAVVAVTVLVVVFFFYFVFFSFAFLFFLISISLSFIFYSSLSNSRIKPLKLGCFSDFGHGANTKCALFDVMQVLLIVSYRRFGTTHIGPFKMGSDRLSRNVGTTLPIDAA